MLLGPGINAARQRASEHEMMRSQSGYYNSRAILVMSRLKNLCCRHVVEGYVVDIANSCSKIQKYRFFLEEIKLKNALYGVV